MSLHSCYYFPLDRHPVDAGGYPPRLYLESPEAPELKSYPVVAVVAVVAVGPVVLRVWTEYGVHRIGEERRQGAIGAGSRGVDAEEHVAGDILRRRNSPDLVYSSVWLKGGFCLGSDRQKNNKNSVHGNNTHHNRGSAP